MKTRLVFATVVLFTAAAKATDLAILRASVAPSFHQVSVEMSVPNPPIQTGPPAARQWTVEVHDANGNNISGVQVMDVNIAKTPAGVPTNEVLLTLPGSVSLAGWSSVLVTYQNGGPKTYRFLGKPGDKPKRIVGADTKDSSDVYVNGSYSPSINSPAQYSYDVAIGYGLPYFTQAHPNLGRLGFSIAGAADKRPNVDPDSYYAGAFWQAYPVRVPHGPLQGLVFQLDTGGEFARKKLGAAQTKTTNYLAPSPRFEFPLRVYPFPGQSVKGVFFTLSPIVGFEYGNNFRNAQQPDGSELIARWLAGADTSLTYKPKIPFLQSLSVSSSWRGRYLERSEIDTTSKFNPSTQDFDFTFNLTKKPRNYVSSKLDWKWTEFFGVTVSHELGAVPPLFNYVDHSVAIGFTFSASFAKDAVQRRK